MAVHVLEVLEGKVRSYSDAITGGNDSMCIDRIGGDCVEAGCVCPPEVTLGLARPQDRRRRRPVLLLLQPGSFPACTRRCRRGSRHRP